PFPTRRSSDLKVHRLNQFASELDAAERRGLAGATNCLLQHLLVVRPGALLFAQLRLATDDLAKGLRIRHVPTLDMRFRTRYDEEIRKRRISLLPNLFSHLRKRRAVPVDPDDEEIRIATRPNFLHGALIEIELVDRLRMSS